MLIKARDHFYYTGSYREAVHLGQKSLRWEISQTKFLVKILNIVKTCSDFKEYCECDNDAFNWFGYFEKMLNDTVDIWNISVNPLCFACRPLELCKLCF